LVICMIDLSDREFFQPIVDAQLGAANYLNPLVSAGLPQMFRKRALKCASRFCGRLKLECSSSDGDFRV
jgi:hypothetical protein